MLTKKISAALLSTLVMAGSVSFSNPYGTDSIVTVEAAEASLTAQSCGDSIIYSLDDKGTLLISGKGDMTNYKYGESPFCFNSRIKRVIISDNINNIGDCAFMGCTELVSVTIPDSAETVGEYAFAGCTGLKSVKFPDYLCSIGNDSFSGCTGLTSVTIPGSVTSIGKEAFINCSELSSITILNPGCKIDYMVFPGNYKGKICGYKGSTAQTFAENYGITFYSLEDNQSTAAPGTTTIALSEILTEVINKNGSEDDYDYADDMDTYTPEQVTITARYAVFDNTGEWSYGLFRNWDITKDVRIRQPQLTDTKNGYSYYTADLYYAGRTITDHQGNTILETGSSINDKYKICSKTPLTTTASAPVTAVTTTTAVSLDELAKSTIALSNGDQFRIPAASDELVFRSNNTDVAVVSANGIITAVGSGDAKISIIDDKFNVVQLIIKVNSVSAATNVTTVAPAVSATVPVTTTTVKPEVSTTMPIATTTIKPTASTTKPIASTTVKPSASTTKPIASTTVKPSASTTKPIASTTIKPAVSTTKPIASTTVKPAASTTKPIVTTTVKPAASTTKSIVTTTIIPAASTTKPIASTTIKPAASTTQPIVSTTIKPAASTTKPIASTTIKPVASTTKPIASTTIKPAVSTTKQIASTTVKPVSTTTITGTAAYSFGDPNGDKKIDANDATLILTNYSILSTGGKTELNAEQQLASDVNSDKKIDAADATAILQYYSYLSTGGKLEFKAFLKQNG